MDFLDISECRPQMTRGISMQTTNHPIALETNFFLMRELSKSGSNSQSQTHKFDPFFGSFGLVSAKRKSD